MSSPLSLAAMFVVAMALPVLAQSKSDQKFPDVVDVKVTARGNETFDFDVTVSSPYDTAQRYADAIRVNGLNNLMLAERVLLHDHANEQPFTRDLAGVKVPTGTPVVVIQARDQKNGYGGKALIVPLPGR